MDPIQSMPTFDALTKQDYTVRDWLKYYKNLWTRNSVARTIDVKTDEVLKAEDPEMEVFGEHGEPMPVKLRLEKRKLLVQDALALLKQVDIMLAIPENEWTEKMWSETALAVAEDMLPKQEEAAPAAAEAAPDDAGAPKAGDTCTTTEGKPGVLKSDGQGGLVCEVVPEANAETAAAAPEAAPEAPSAEAKV